MRAPEALRDQASAALAAVSAARRYFESPSVETAPAVQRARAAAKEARAKTDLALETEAGPRADWLAVSAALADLADEAVWAVDESERFGTELAAPAPEIAVALEAAAAGLAEALKRPAEEPLARAKNKALLVEEIRRKGRRTAQDQPRLTAELASTAVLDRFSRAGEAVHRAADALAAHLGERS